MSSPNVVYSQQERLLKIKTPLGETQLVLERLEGVEELSRLFEFQVTMLSENWEIDAKALLRKPATISILLSDGTERFFHALFANFCQEGPASEKLMVYKATLVPKLWFQTLNSDCRIYQEKTTREIVELLLKEAGVTDFSFRLNGTYPKREYCVQYRESTFNFIARLLEEEGIFFFFEHEKTKHTIVFCDHSPGRALLPEQKVAMFANEAGWTMNKKDGVTVLFRQEQAHTGKVSLTDYFFEKPKVNLAVSQAGKEPEEIYDYPGRYTEIKEGDRYARVQLEERECQQYVVDGAGRCRAFRPGFLFELKGHYRTDTNQEYFITSVQHQIVDTSYRSSDGLAHDYNNRFTAIPKKVPFRPARLARKPVVQGPQTAVVVGKSGEEIWVDKYGRVKVQFFWDRKGKKNETSSCWVRVSQAWAGRNWGWVTLPRIGQEVIVDFLEGDPDCPIITGRVYNDDQMPPYALVANQTQSGIKTRSSKGGGTADFNEIRFEDKKGQEMFTIHAQKDMDTTVENDDTQLVQRNRTITVDGTHTETIKGNTTITITEGNHTRTINKGNKTTTIKMGNETTTLDMGNQSTQLKMGNKSTKLDLGKAVTEAMQSIELKVGASSIKVDQTGVTIKGMMITIEGSTMTQVKGNAVLILKGGVTLIN